MKKYNLSKIMRKAWELYRGNMSRNSFRTCLSESWKIAKAELNKEVFKKVAVFEDHEFRFWQGGSNRRIYVNGRHSGGMYIDLNTMKIVSFRKTWAEAIVVAEKFLAHYQIAC